MNTEKLFHSIIQRIATGPELGKNIEEKEAEAAMSAILNSEIDNVQAAIFLIALRMKRETMDENIGILKAIQRSINSQIADVKNLIDIGDPYSGYERSIPISAFLPPLLAEIGLPTVIHGLDGVSPKFGLTHRHINSAMGLDADISVSNAKARIENTDIGWSYLDQGIYCEQLYRIVPLRNMMVKRTVINTLENLLRPLRGKNTHSILGYVHKPYVPTYAALTDSAGFDTNLLVRGVEGGVVPSLRQKSLMISYIGNVEKARFEIDPKTIGLNQELRSIPFPRNLNTDNAKNRQKLAEYTVSLGMEALSGGKGMYYDGLVYIASMVLVHLNQFKSIEGAASKVRMVLDSGRAINRIN